MWNSPIITHSKDPLENPLTTLPSEELENKALQLFKVKHCINQMLMQIDSLVFFVPTLYYYKSKRGFSYVFLFSLM